VGQGMGFEIQDGLHGKASTLRVARALKRMGRWIFPCALSGLLMGLAFPSASIWPLAWLGLVPLLWSLEKADLRRGFFKGWMTGLLFHCVAGYMTARSHPITALLGPYLGLSWGAFGLLYCWLRRRRVPSWLCCCLSWPLAEALRRLGPLAFPWIPLAVSQAPVPFMIQVVAWTGTMGLSSLIAGWNGWLVDLLRSLREERSQKGLSLASQVHMAVVPGLVLFAALSGVLILRHADKVVDRLRSWRRIRVAAIQANIPGELKWSGDYYEEALKIYSDLTREAAKGDPEFIIWCECSLGDTTDITWEMVPLDVRKLAEEIGIPILTGAVHHDRVRVISYNSATVVSPTGRMIGRYDKMKLLPFAETVPEGLGFLAGEHARETGYEPAKRQVLLSLFPSMTKRPDTVKLGVLICFEALFTELGRAFPRLGADFFVHLSDEYWYRDRNASRQSEAMDVLRAVEIRRSLVRASNAGPSSIIDPWGRTTTTFRDKEGNSCFTPGAMVGEVVLVEGETFYSRAGDWVTMGCLGLYALLFCLSFRQK